MPVSRVGTFTGATTTDTITITGAAPPGRCVAVRLRGPAAGGAATFNVATGASVVAGDVTIDGNDFIHLDNTRPEHPVEVGQATDISIKMRGTASAAYVVIAE